MYLEEDKDFIIGSDGEVQLSDENSISWDEVLDETKTNDNVVSIRDDSDNSDDMQFDADSLVDLDDELSIEQDANEDETLEDEQLQSILTNNKTEKSPKKEAFDAFGDGGNAEINDFDFDVDLSDSPDADTQENNQEPQMTRKEEIGIKKSKSSSVSPLLLAIVLFLVVICGVYYYMTFIQGEEVSQGQLLNSSVQNDMDNTTKEDIENRNGNIDIVNEDEVNEIKPDENIEEEEEKKEVLQIIPTGRINPFLPTGKYAGEVKKITMYDNVKIPKPPTNYGQDNPERNRMLTIAVSGIMYDPQKPSAIITFEGDDYFVQKGDKLENYNVIDITRNYVLISLGKDIYKASVGEKFKINTTFGGNAKYISSGRQYYKANHGSSGEREHEEDIYSPNGYTSESDIDVREKF